MKKPIVIAILCHKGGVAKTTTCLSIADGIVSKDPNSKVLIVDADEQANVKTVFGIKLHEAEGGLASILGEGLNPETIKVKVRNNIDAILSGGRTMRDFERYNANSPDNEFVLSKRLRPFDKDYDYVLIDSPPALSLISTNIAMYADYCVIPCTADLLAVVGVRSTLFFLENLENHFKKSGLKPCKVAGIVPTVFDQRRNIDMSILDDLQLMANNDLTRGGIIFDPIRSDTRVKTAQVKRKLILEVFPQSKAGEDYRKLVDDLLAQIGRLEDGVDRKNNTQGWTSQSKPAEMTV